MVSKVESAIPLTLEPASSAEFDAVSRLLSASNLPVSDLESHIAAFTLAKADGLVVGTAGLEIYGELALVRSLCVVASRRSDGIGAALLEAVTSCATAQGVQEFYLLTTGAAPYFAKLGFVPLAREQAPLEIRNTAQFSSLCPSSAVCMRKPITSEHGRRCE
jgi:N-acetylglutamate synthase-like GNAT family acetyltransferase